MTNLAPNDMCLGATTSLRGDSLVFPPKSEWSTTPTIWPRSVIIPCPIVLDSCFRCELGRAAGRRVRKGIFPGEFDLPLVRQKIFTRFPSSFFLELGAGKGYEATFLNDSKAGFLQTTGSKPSATRTCRFQAGTITRSRRAKSVPHSPGVDTN